ncbi:MAG: response regulator [Sedimentisphaerales bacterium]|nr:response regulator [Sedimentisphaerales bacterium]MBN2842069.1 response regulator [Sedimentisphaerales bacterium]
MVSGTIKSKLIKIIVGVSLICLVVSSLCFLLWFSYIFKENLVKTLEVQAHITAENCSAALAFEDKDEAASVLSALRHNKEIVSCILFDKAHEFFAAYPADTPADFNGEDYCVIKYMVNLEGEHLGELTIFGSYSKFYSTIYYGAALVCVMSVFCFFLSLLLGGKMQKLISVPILKLKDVTYEITQSKDYSTRIEVISDDEVGSLAGAFNEMLMQIQDRDRELQVYNKELEGKVEERTRELEESMHKAQDLADKAQIANRAKSEFLANMSHELRTPMNAIIGFTSVILCEEISPQHRQYMMTIDSSARNLLKILNDILDFSKIEAGRLDIEAIPFSLLHVMEEIRSEMNPLAVDRGITLEVSCDKQVPVAQIGDPLRLKQCLVNLIGNAIKFTHEGTVSLNVVFEPDSSNKMLRFEVKDTGIGIPEDKLKLIFEAFSQADGSTSRKYGGTGLGLSITRNLVKLMNGRLALESEFGVGSAFSIIMPSRPCTTEEKSEGLDEPVVKAEKLTEQGEEHTYEGAKILIAEDNISNQELLKTFLSKTKIKYEIAPNGLDAVNKWQTSKDYDMIFMDIQMPIMNGYEAVIELRKIGCTVPIVALTANAMQRDVQQCLAVGCDCHVAKPLDRDTFLSVLKKYLTSVNAGAGES